MLIALDMGNKNLDFYLELLNAHGETINNTVRTSALKCIQEILIDVNYKNPKYLSHMMPRQWVISSRNFEKTTHFEE